MSPASVLTSVRPVALAAELVARGAELVVVGGAARWLRDGVRRPLDLDVVVTPGQVAVLVEVLGLLGTVTSAASLLRGRDVRLSTSWGPLDVFVTEPPPSDRLVLHGVAVAVEVAA